VKPGTVFYKMSGSGNDFLMIDGRYVSAADFTPEAIRAACHRRLGVGADGVIMLDPEAPAGAHFTFRFWNSDGSEGPMCGNGALCATRLAVMLELAPEASEVVFVTRAGVHRGRVVDGRAEIELPDFPLPKPADIPLEPGEQSPMFAEPSVPHVVLEVGNVGTVDVERRGPPLRRHANLPAGGANVNWISPAAGGGWHMRTFERGVEGETLACGTGAVASALVVGTTHGASSPVRIWTRSGLPLDVSWTVRGSKASHVRLAGDARVTFKGKVGDVLTPANQ
jgi:diaminopimelate epimerase